MPSAADTVLALGSRPLAVSANPESTDPCRTSLFVKLHDVDNTIPVLSSIDEGISGRVRQQSFFRKRQLWGDLQAELKMTAEFSLAVQATIRSAHRRATVDATKSTSSA